MAYIFKEAAITATATSLTSLFGLGSNQHFKTVILQNAPGALNPIAIGASGVTTTTNRGRSLAAAEAETFGQGDYKAGSTDEIFAIGVANAANNLLMSLELN